MPLLSLSIVDWARVANHLNGWFWMFQKWGNLDWLIFTFYYIIMILQSMHTYIDISNSIYYNIIMILESIHTYIYISNMTKNINFGIGTCMMYYWMCRYITGSLGWLEIQPTDDCKIFDTAVIPLVGRKWVLEPTHLTGKEKKVTCINKSDWQIYHWHIPLTYINKSEDLILGNGHLKIWQADIPLARRGKWHALTNLKILILGNSHCYFYVSNTLYCIN